MPKSRKPASVGTVSIPPLNNGRTATSAAAFEKVARAFKFVTSPRLPIQILIGTGALATAIVTAGLGIWSIVGAWKVFMVLVRGE